MFTLQQPFFCGYTVAFLDDEPTAGTTYETAWALAPFIDSNTI